LRSPASSLWFNTLQERHNNLGVNKSDIIKKHALVLALHAGLRVYFQRAHARQQGVFDEFISQNKRPDDSAPSLRN